MESSSIQIHKGDPNEPVVPDLIIHSFQKEKSSFDVFGVLQMKMKTVPIVKHPILLYFMIDSSGSMDDLCKDRRTKMYHVLNTITNIIKYCAKRTSQVYILVDTFDIKIQSIIPLTPISAETEEILISKLKEINPENSTNIELALETVRERIDTYREKFPDIYHIFMTDGEANVGVENPYQLSQNIHPDSNHIFIGFGNTHNVTMLKIFSAHNIRCDYRFIDNGENAGMVYGEIMHSILYPALKDVSITILNGQIYDWRNNDWTSVYQESFIDSEILKTYHIRCEKKTELRVIIHGKTYFETNECENYADTTHVVYLPETSDTELYKYIFRQQTMELLSQCTKSDISRNACVNSKKEIREFFRQMREFMRRRHCMYDPFMCLLCEDIITAYNTIGTHLCQMYCTSRQSSQGRQSSYTVKYTEETVLESPPRNKFPCPPILRRQTNRFEMDTFVPATQPEMYDDPFDIEPLTTFHICEKEKSHNPFCIEDDIEYHIQPSISDVVLNQTYSTPGRQQLMSELSQQTE
jgi:uncharacterized protein YegL